MRKLVTTLFIAAGVLAFACKKDPPPPKLEPKLSVIQKEIFEKSCTFSSCHNAAAHRGDLDLSNYDASSAALARPPKNEIALGKGLKLVTPANPEASFLYKKLVATEEGEGAVMPKKSAKLEAYKIDAVREWILAGAQKN